MDIASILLALFIAFLWALNTVIYKYGMTKAINYKTVIVVGAFTYFVAMAAFALYHSKIIIKDLHNTNMKDIALIAFGAFIGTFVATILFMELLERHHSSLVTTITYTTPIFVFVLAFVILEEKLDMLKVYGILTTILGIVVIGYNAPSPVPAPA